MSGPRLTQKLEDVQDVHQSAQNKSSHGIYSHTSVSQTVLLLYELLKIVVSIPFRRNFHDFLEGHANDCYIMLIHSVGDSYKLGENCAKIMQNQKLNL